MAIDTPARIAIIGAGPIGLEAALYARYLGYDVDVYEAGAVLEHVRRWQHVRMFTPWAENVSPLGMAAIQAQDPDWHPPAADAVLLGREMLERYWQPLAESDLIVDNLHLHTRVVSIGRPHMLKHELPGDEARGDDNFILLLRSRDGRERLATADVVIDTSGVLGQPNAAGQGGIFAPGELSLRAQIEWHIPDVHGSQRAAYQGRRVLVIGDGHSAATTVVALAALEPRPTVLWATRNELLASVAGPLDELSDDPLAERRALVQAANRLANSTDQGVEHFSGTSLATIERLAESDRYRIELVGLHAGTIEVDRVVANVGFSPDLSLFEALQARLSHLTSGVEQLITGPAGLLLAEPNFYLLGAKSFGRDSRFFIREGLRQIRDLFTIIGDRATLDLYQTHRP